MFVITHCATLESFVPFALLVQSVGSLPDRRVRARAQAISALAEQDIAIQSVEAFLDWFAFVVPYLPQRDSKRFVHIWSSHQWGRTFPLLSAALPSLLSTQTFHDLDVCFDAPPNPESKFMLHGACECAFRRVRPLRYGPLNSGNAEHPRQPQRDQATVKVEWSGWRRCKAVVSRRRRRKPLSTTMPRWVAPASNLLNQSSTRLLTYIKI